MFSHFIADVTRPDITIMPAAPHSSSLPSLSAGPVALEFHREVAELHLAAFTALYGPCPAGLAVVRIQQRSDTDQHVFAIGCTAATTLTMGAALWLEAFEAGLASWSEAGFPDPITVTPRGDGLTDFSIAPYAEVIRYARSCYAATKQHTRHRNLLAATNPGLPID